MRQFLQSARAITSGRFFVVAVSGLLLTSCMEDNFKKYVELGELRILGLVASQPEVNPGASVTITPWISDINNSSALTYSWVACVDPGVSRGADPDCDGNSTATAVQSGSVTTLATGDTFTGAADSFSVTIPATILVGRSAADQFNGVAYIISYTLIAGGGTQSVKAIKRVIASDPSKTTKNQNPVINDVLANGVAFTNLNPSSKYVLSSNLTPAEAFQLQRQDDVRIDRVETLQSTWFYTDGSVKFYRTLNADTNTYDTPAAFPAARKSFVILAVRDGRGGQAFLKKNVSP